MNKLLLFGCFACGMLLGGTASAAPWPGFTRGMGIGGWLTNYKRFNVLPMEKQPDKILWNGEFGTIRHAPKASRVAYMRDVVSLCKEHGIPWCVWNYLSTPNDGNRFSLVDDDTREILSKDLLDACLGQ